MGQDDRKSDGVFIPYPTDRVVGAIDDPNAARAAIEALLQSDFARDAIDVVHGEGGLERLDPTGAKHGFLARFQRTLIRTASPAEEYRHLSRHVEDVRAGRFVVMVLAKQPAQRDVAAQILSSHGAEFIGFYGRWAYQAFGDDHAGSQGDAEDSPFGKSYHLRVGDVVTRIRMESEVSAIVSDPQRSSAEVRTNVTRITAGIFLLSWQDAAGVPVIHIADFERGIAYAVLRGLDGDPCHVSGTVQHVV